MRITIENIKERLVGQYLGGWREHEIKAVFEWETCYEIMIQDKNHTALLIAKLYRRELTKGERIAIGADTPFKNDHIFKIEMGKHRWYLNGLRDVNEDYVKQGIGCLLAHYKLTKKK